MRHARARLSRFQGSSVRADCGLSIQAEYDQLVSSELHSRPVELSAWCLPLSVSIKFDRRAGLSDKLPLTRNRIKESNGGDFQRSVSALPFDSRFDVITGTLATLSEISPINLERTNTACDVACVIRRIARLIAVTVIETVNCDRY